MKSCRFGLTLVIILALTAILMAWLGPALFEKAPSDAKLTGSSLPLSTFSSKPILIAAKGVVESAQEIDLSSQVKGEIESVLVDEGDRVTTGQLLIQMNSRKVLAHIELTKAKLAAAQAVLKEQISGFRHEDIAAALSAVERAQAVLKQAQIEEQRQRRLLSKGAIPRIDWEHADEKRRVALAQLNELKAQAEKLQKGFRSENIEQSRAKVAEAAAELKYYQAVLADYTVYSPIDGVVIQREVDDKEAVDIGTLLLKLINPQQLRIHAEVEEADIGKALQGQKAEVTVDNLPGEIFKGKVYQVFPTVNKKTQRAFDPMASFDINTQKVYIALDDYTGLVHGMTVNVRFIK